MPTQEASGTVAATGAEQTLASITLNRSLSAFVDLSNMGAGDEIILRQKRRILSAVSTLRTFETVPFVGVQSDPDAAGMSPVSSPFEYELTLHQTKGVLRNFDFSVESL